MEIPEKISFSKKPKNTEGRYLVEIKGEKVALSAVEALDVINQLSMAMRIDHEYSTSSTEH